MVGGPGGSRPTAAQTHFSVDGFWWWDGAEWKPAVSQDRLWRWNGHDWEPNGSVKASGAGSGVGAAVGLTVASFVGVLILVSAIVVVVLLTMGNQITNVFSNTLAALGL